MADSYERYQRARAQFSDAVQKSIDRREARRDAEAKARQEQELEAQRIAAQARRDKQQHLYEMVGTAHRGNIAAGAAERDFRYTTERDKQLQKGTLKRDTLQHELTSERDRQQAIEQARRDQRLFGYSTQENEQQFGQQLQRDQLQHGYTTERDQLQQRNTLQRDYLQSGIQADRDQRLNQFDIQRETLQQQFTQQNMYQRETADVAAKWQEQIQQARNAGLDFSPRQQQEMKELDAAFRKNVLNGPYDEGLKQQAMLEHQKKLAAIIPEEKVQNPRENLEQSLMFHEPTQSWYMMGRDSKGFPTFEPLGGPGQDMQKQQAAQQQASEKEAEKLRKAEDDREDRFEDVVNQMETKLNPLTDDPLYTTREEAVKAAMDVFAPREKIYRDRGLPPHWAFQKEADTVRANLEEKQRLKQQQALAEQQAMMERQQRQPPAGMADSTRLRSGDTVRTTTNIDAKIKETADSGDQAANVALEVIKRITARNGGPPPEGSEDFAHIVNAYNILEQRGVSVDDLKKPEQPRSAGEVSGTLFNSGLR